MQLLLSALSAHHALEPLEHPQLSSGLNTSSSKRALANAILTIGMNLNQEFAKQSTAHYEHRALCYGSHLQEQSEVCPSTCRGETYFPDRAVVASVVAEVPDHRHVTALQEFRQLRIDIVAVEWWKRGGHSWPGTVAERVWPSQRAVLL